RRSMIISDKEKRTTAVHESGHALVARFVAGAGGLEADPVHKVTIIPRGRALGLTQQLPTEDRLSMTREFAQNQIAILLGGRVAELLVEHRADLERVADALLDYETIDGDDIDRLLKGEKIARPMPASRKREPLPGKPGDEESKKRPALIPPIGKGDPEPEPV